MMRLIARNAVAHPGHKRHRLPFGRNGLPCLPRLPDAVGGRRPPVGSGVDDRNAITA